MSTQPKSELHKAQPLPLGSLYCADPECEYCKELRKTQEQLAQQQQKAS